MRGSIQLGAHEPYVEIGGGGCDDFAVSDGVVHFIYVCQIDAENEKGRRSKGNETDGKYASQTK